MPVVDDQGKPVLDAAGTVRTERVGFIGLLPVAWRWCAQPITAVPGDHRHAVGQTAGVILRIPQKMVGVAQAAFGSGRARPERPDVASSGSAGSPARSPTARSPVWQAAA